MTAFEKLIVCFLFTIFHVQAKGRLSKRSLFFPTSTVLQFTYGLSVPITIDGSEEGTTILLSTCLQGNYDLPKKSSNLEVHELTKRETVQNTDLSKSEIYYYIVEYLNSLDLNGEDCLARAVCELAKYPLDIDKNDNVLEKIMHFVLTPSEEMDYNNNTFYWKLLMAEEAGQKKDRCEVKYRSCGVSLASLFTSFFI